MKTIIKEGKKEFIGRCKNCGCEFKYELEDISFSSVQCPFCYSSVVHNDQTVDIDDVVQDNFGNPVYPYYNPIDIPIPSDLYNINSDYTCQTINEVESNE